MEAVMMYGTQARADMHKAVTDELMTWTRKALDQTARACGIGYLGKMSKVGVARSLATKWINCPFVPGMNVPHRHVNTYVHG